MKRLLLAGAVLAVSAFGAPAAVAVTSAAQRVADQRISTAETQGASAVAQLYLNARASNDQGMAAAIMARAPSDTGLRIAMANNAVVTSETTGASPTAPAPPIASAAARPRAHAAACHGMVNNTSRWYIWPYPDNVGWVASRVEGWCYNGSFITSITAPGWQFNDWEGIMWCPRNESQLHYGFGASDGYGHTAWAKGGHWMTLGTNTAYGCIAGTAKAATLRIAGNGYWDTAW